MSKEHGSDQRASRSGFATPVRDEYEARLRSGVTRIRTAMDKSVGYTDYGLRTGVRNFRAGCRRQWKSLWFSLRCSSQRERLMILLSLLQDISELLGAYASYVNAKNRVNAAAEDHR